MYFNEITSHIAHILDVFMSAQNIRECLGFGYSVLHRGTSLGQLKLLCTKSSKYTATPSQCVTSVITTGS